MEAESRPQDGNIRAGPSKSAERRMGQELCNMTPQGLSLCRGQQDLSREPGRPWWTKTVPCSPPAPGPC